MKKFLKAISFIFFLTVFTILETTDVSSLSIERFPSIFFGCLTTVIIKFYIIPVVVKMKNKENNKGSNDLNNQNEKDN
jgi:hypothetical protein